MDIIQIINNKKANLKVEYFQVAEDEILKVIMNFNNKQRITLKKRTYHKKKDKFNT
jgi:hypothetical protein